MPPVSLTEKTLKSAVDHLTEQDEHLRAIFERYGYPPMWAREQGFATLVHIILEQQVSLASARAAMDKLIAALPAVTPEHFLALDDAQLREIGFSRQKTRYGRELAHAILNGTLDIDRLVNLSDQGVRK